MCSPPSFLQVAYNADRRRQLWEQTARDDLKELNDLRALVKAEEERAEAKKQEAHARGAEVGVCVCGIRLHDALYPSTLRSVGSGTRCTWMVVFDWRCRGKLSTRSVLRRDVV